MPDDDAVREVRPRAAGAGPLESAQQCRKIHAKRRLDPAFGRAAKVRKPCFACGTTASAFRPKCSPRSSIFHSGRTFARSVPRRAGSRTDVGPPAGRNARRPHRGRQRRPGPRQRVHGAASRRLTGHPAEARPEGTAAAESVAPASVAHPGGRRQRRRGRQRRLALCASRHEVRTAHDGRSALEWRPSFGRRSSCSTSVCRKLDGYEVGRRLRSSPDTRDALHHRGQRLRPGRRPPALDPGRASIIISSSRSISRPCSA